MSDEQNNPPRLALSEKLTKLGVDMDYVKDGVREIKDTIKRDYITRNEFEPIKKIVYGLVSLILMGVVTAVLALVIK